MHADLTTQNFYMKKINYVHQKVVIKYIKVMPKVIAVVLFIS